jgi:hypothetical protein
LPFYSVSLNKRGLEPRLLPADRKVSVGWQIVALFIPIANFWAFYRIRKLRKYVLYVVMPSVALAIVATYRVFTLVPMRSLPYDDSLAFSDPVDPFAVYQDPVYIAITAINWALFGLSVYLVIKWSRAHNRQFDQPTLT